MRGMGLPGLLTLGSGNIKIIIIPRPFRGMIPRLIIVTTSQREVVRDVRV